MIKLRLGKTISIRWKIKNNGTPISSEDKVTLFATDCVGRKYKLPILSIAEGCVSSSFSPTLQARIGVYSLTIWKDYGTPDQCPVDAINAFELVPFSNMEECSFQPEDPVVVIESCLAIGAPANINGYNTITIKGDSVQQEGSTLIIDSYAKSQTYSQKEVDKKITALEDDAQLQNATTVAAQVGKVPAGAKYDANTPVSSIIADILAFATPAFTTLAINDGTKDYSSNTNVFCDSEAMRFQAIKHAESNVGSIKGKVSLNINGTKSDQTPSATVASVTTDKVFTRSTNKASFFVELTGTNTLSAAIPRKRVTLTAYMPVYTFITTAQDEATVKTGLNAATAETTVYTSSHTIDKTITVKAGGAWCVALPSHLGVTGMGTVADFGFKTEDHNPKSISATRTVNGIASVPYTIYLFPQEKDQTDLNVRIITKSK